MFFRRKELPWEVVHSCSVDPVPVYYDSDDDDLDSIVSVKDNTVRRTYVLELKKPASTSVHRKAVMFAQERLLEEIEQNGYNTLLSESWTFTLLRKADAHRIQVEYRGTPALSMRTIKRRQPPFMGVLQAAY
ncbi:hypothetical protein CVT24_006057 [Panaeolus cyanescens]|uniref:Uncharacterized protein n=1 Tax=Panaeolus cyanescens TaxID=181874 RepID=A0A409YDV8_9AGAR|nr:hypothetical protein CVT24_006057 [Panaeolus cyanescens]